MTWWKYTYFEYGQYVIHLDYYIPGGWLYIVEFEELNDLYMYNGFLTEC